MITASTHMGPKPQAATPPELGEGAAAHPVVPGAPGAGEGQGFSMAFSALPGFARVLYVEGKAFSDRLLVGASHTSKLLASVLAAAYVMGIVAPWTADTFALTPGTTIPKVWNVVTAGYFPYGTGLISLVSVVFDVIMLLSIGKVLEPYWGPSEFLKFIAIVNAGVGVCTFLSMFVLYIVTQSQFYIFAKFGGFHGVIAGLLVAMRQNMPDEEPWGINLGFRCRHLSGAYVAATFLLCIASGASHAHIGLWMFVLWGTYVSWVYLRFFQTREGEGGPGDPSQDMGFEMLFPGPLQLIVRNAVARPLGRVFCDPQRPLFGLAPPQRRLAANPLDAAAYTGHHARAGRLERASQAIDQKMSTGGAGRGSRPGGARPAAAGSGGEAAEV